MRSSTPSGSGSSMELAGLHDRSESRPTLPLLSKSQVSLSDAKLEARSVLHSGSGKSGGKKAKFNKDNRGELLTYGKSNRSSSGLPFFASSPVHHSRHMIPPRRRIRHPIPAAASTPVGHH